MAKGNGNNRIWKKAFLLGLALMVVFAMSGCTTFDNFRDSFFGDGTAKNSVKVAIYEPTTGSDAYEAADEIKGMELAHEMCPEVNGNPVELIYADTGSDINRADTALVDLMNKEPDLILGSYGSAYSLLAGEYVLENKIPAITATNENPYVTMSNDFYFRVSYSPADEGKVMAAFVNKQYAGEPVAILTPNEDGRASMVSTEFENAYCEAVDDEDAITIKESYAKGDTDYARQFGKMQGQGVKVVVLTGSYEDSVAIIKQARELELDFVFVGTSVLDTEALELDVQYGKVFFLAMNAAGEVNEDYLAFIEANYDGEITIPLLLGFDAYMVGIKAIEAAGTTDGEAVAGAMAEMEDFNGAAGDILSFNDGDPVRAYTVRGLDMGKRQDVTQVIPR